MNVVSLKDNATQINVAVVESVEQGRAKTVVWPERSEKSIEVYGHLSHVPVINKFDEVLVQETGKGVVIVGVIAEHSSAPAAQIEDVNGVVTVRGAKAVRLQTENALIEVSSQGKVSIDGKQVYQQAEQSMTLKGYPIELN